MEHCCCCFCCCLAQRAHNFHSARLLADVAAPRRATCGVACTCRVYVRHQRCGCVCVCQIQCRPHHLVSWHGKEPRQINVFIRALQRSLDQRTSTGVLSTVINAQIITNHPVSPLPTDGAPAATRHPKLRLDYISFPVCMCVCRPIGGECP